MDISIMNSNDIEGLSEFIGDDIQIVNIKFREDLHFIEMMATDNEVYRAFANSRKKAIANTLKAIQRVH